MELDTNFVLTRLERDTDHLAYSHDLYETAQQSELARRRAMVAELKRRVRAGTYRPNLTLIAERMLAEGLV